MKGFILFLLAITFIFASTNMYAGKRNSNKSKNNIYISKKFKGHSCPKPRKIINAKYF